MVQARIKCNSLECLLTFQIIALVTQNNPRTNLFGNIKHVDVLTSRIRERGFVLADLGLERLEVPSAFSGTCFVLTTGLGQGPSHWMEQARTIWNAAMTWQFLAVQPPTVARTIGNEKN